MFTQTQRNFSILISLHKKYNATWVRTHSFLLEGGSLVIAPPPAVASEIVHQDALAYLNSVRAWARLFHVSASGA